MFQINLPRHQPLEFTPQDVKVTQRERVLAATTAEEVFAGTGEAAPAVATESVALPESALEGADYDFEGVAAAGVTASGVDFGEKLTGDAILAQAPYAAVGKLRWSQWNKDKSKVEVGAGTAWINRANIVFTAAHNLWSKQHNEAHWDFVFLPRFRNGFQAGPGFVFEGAVAAVPESFKKATGNYTAFDMGFLVLTKRAQETAGRLGWVANIPVNSGYQLLGYPSGVYPDGTVPPAGMVIPYDGGSMWRHAAALHSIPDKPSVPGYESGTMRFYNPYTKGASGGPWCMNYAGKGWGANGINGKKVGYNVTASPYFGPGFVDMVTASQKYQIGS